MGQINMESGYAVCLCVNAQAPSPKTPPHVYPRIALMSQIISGFASPCYPEDNGPSLFSITIRA